MCMQKNYHKGESFDKVLVIVKGCSVSASRSGLTHVYLL